MHKLNLLECFLIILLACFSAISYNYFRLNGIQWIRQEPYNIFVPCPESMGEVVEYKLKDILNEPQRYHIIDARPKNEYVNQHYIGSINIPFDYLVPIPSSCLKRLAKIKGKKIAVYGDGLDPDSGKELALEISGKGIKNVGYVYGGIKKINPAKSL